MVSNRWIKRAIKQTKKTIIKAENGLSLYTSRYNCAVCDYVKSVHNIFVDLPYHNGCENIKGMKCPARDMCLEYCKALKRQFLKKPLIKRLEKHLVKLNTLLEESQ